jgi:hypothetical protein
LPDVDGAFTQKIRHAAGGTRIRLSGVGGALLPQPEALIPAKTKAARPKQGVAETQLALQLIEGQADLVCIVAEMQRNTITDCERQTRAVT